MVFQVNALKRVILFYRSNLLEFLGCMPVARSMWSLHKWEMIFISIYPFFFLFFFFPPFNLKNILAGKWHFKLCDVLSWGLVCLLIGRTWTCAPTSSLVVGTKMDGCKVEKWKFQQQFILGSNVHFSKPLSEWQQVLFP